MNKPKGKWFTILSAFLVICLAGFGLAEAGNSGQKPVADVSIGSSGIHFVPNVSYRGLVISVSGPDGFVARKTATGGSPYFALSEFNGGNCPDGLYSYELRVVPFAGIKKARAERAKHEQVCRAQIQSGHFTVRGGAILVPQGGGEGIARTQDVLHDDDVLITGGLCVGSDCSIEESFGNDILKLNHHYVHLYFEDTSGGTYPGGDWRIQINDTAEGGASYFSVQDATNAVQVFTLETGAPANSLYVEDNGHVGLGTSIPYVKLHIVDGDSPTIRLEQDSSSSLTPQSWDIIGDDAGFSVCDVTNSSKVPFKIEPNTPSNTICLKSNGRIGIGTSDPACKLEIETTGENAMIVLTRTDGPQVKLNAISNQGQVGTRTAHKFNIVTSNINRISIDEDGDVGIGVNWPSYLLELSGGAYCDGGAWVAGSSREYKENISPVSLDDALATLETLDPVKFNYKKNPEEDYLGFIAEDVPELVATKTRKGINTMDVVAVLTRVMQEQQRDLSLQQKHLSQQQNQLSQQQAMIENLQKEIARLKKE